MIVARRSFLLGDVVAAAEFGTGAGAGRWQLASPVRYPDPDVKILDPRFERLALRFAAIERIASGCRFCEGPVWFGDGRYLLWSDIPNDRIMRWDEETGAVGVFRKPSNYANGNTRDRQGRLVTCEHDSQRVTRTEHDGSVTVLADSFEGKQLTGPNDVVVKSDCSIWFSDNGAGTRGNYLGHTAAQELPFRVYRLDGSSGRLTIAVGDMQRPNGLCFSPDETKLYVVDTPAGDKTVHVYDVVDNGSRVANGRVFFNALPGYADGIRCDTLGNVWCGFSGGEGRSGLRARRQNDRPHPVAGALRECLLRRPQAQSPVHGGEPVDLFALCRGARRARRVTKRGRRAGQIFGAFHETASRRCRLAPLGDLIPAACRSAPAAVRSTKKM
jgi:gluconolactonase